MLDLNQLGPRCSARTIHLEASDLVGHRAGRAWVVFAAFLGWVGEDELITLIAGVKLGCDIGGAKELGVIYFPTNWGAKEPQNLPNHRVVRDDDLYFWCI